MSGQGRGEVFDRCPQDGCIEVERSAKSGGVDSKGEQYLSWSTFTADKRKGGCGATWPRTTQQGLQERQAKGAYTNTDYLTPSATVARVHSAPSDAYRRNYDRIAWNSRRDGSVHVAGAGGSDDGSAEGRAG